MMNTRHRKKFAQRSKLKFWLKWTSLTLTAITLTGCSQTSGVSKSALSIYQPEYLILNDGQTLQTSQGIYTTQQCERWWSDKAYRKLLEDSIEAGF